MLHKLIKDLERLANKNKSLAYARFFKTEKGEYGEGDVFLGLTVPIQRKIALEYTELELTDLRELLSSKIHEHRLVALLILVEKYENSKEKQRIFDFYMKNISCVNNWDLVDATSHKILGDYIASQEKSLIYKLAKSENLWERRISIVSTLLYK